MARAKHHTRRPHFRVTDDWETCPDCSERDAVSFTFGHVQNRAMDDPAVVGGAVPVLSFARSERGQSRVKGCETCKGLGIIRVLRDSALPAVN